MPRKVMVWILEKAALLILATVGLAGFASAQIVSRSTTANVSPTLAKLDAQTQTRVAEAYGNLPLSFEPNQGQSDPRVKFLARGGGYTLFLTNGEAVLRLAAAQRGTPNRVAHQAVVQMKLVGANPKPVVSGMDEQPGTADYFIGNDPKKWKTDVPNYARVRYQGIYPGVDLIYYGNQGQLEYDLLVAPGSNPKAITLDVEPGLVSAGRERSGHVLPRIDRNGDLVVELNGGEIRFHKPVAYQDVAVSFAQSKAQDRKFIAAAYVLKSKNQVGIRLESYDATQPLVIDPVVWYSTYLGGSNNDQASGIAVDGAGNVYVTGFTQSVDFPMINQISGACQPGCDKGTQDAFVTKIDASGKKLVYSSYLGGSGNDSASAIAVDSVGNVYLTGVENSSDFPRVNQISGACVGSCGGGANNDAFVAKINAVGNALVYSSVVGGSRDENAFGFAGIAVDGAGDAYLTGTTDSTDFPRVNQIPGACNGSCGGGSTDVFVTKINAAGSALVYSSYLGGSGTDIGFGIAVDSSGNAYATGLIGSPDFPRVHQIAGACSGACGSGSTYDVYATKINAAGSALVYSSYLGGSEDDYGRGIAVDAAGNAYLAGRASSDDFPGVNQISGACLLNSCSAFAAKINAAGDALVYSSRFGGSSGSEQGHAIAVDGSGNAYITGETQSSDFPQVNPIPGACRGSCGTGQNRDGFVTKIDAAGDALVYSSYLGGSGDDDGGALVCNASVAVDSSQSAYLSGCTLSTDFPRGRLEIAAPLSIPGACNGSCGSGGFADAFVTKISK